MPKRVARLGLLLPAAFAVACAGDGAPADFTAVDSAGVTIAVSTSPAWSIDPAKAWNIAATPVLDLTRTGAGPAHEFYRVSGATRFDDGRIVVANSGTSELRMFSAEGLPITTVGREGDGPGEYKQIMSVNRIGGDSLIVHSWPRRISVLDPDLSFNRSFALHDMAQNVYPLGQGSILAALTFSSLMDYEGPSKVIRAPAHLARLTTVGEVIDTVAVAAGGEELMLRIGDRRISAGILFGKTMSVGVGAGSIVTGDAERMEFVVLSPDGVPTLIARVPGYPLSISNDELEAERDARMGPNPTSRIREIIDQMPTPSTKPAFTDLLIDSEGHIWAGAHQPFATFLQEPAPRSWEIFDPDGRWLGALETPVGFTVYEVGTNYILGVFADSLGVEHVQLLDLTRQP